ncbi:TrmH family RNA methyltransferase [Ferruginibacter sp. SUN106]|uniref:TrmH family RNA methyltransferase n=1 Tax=Ferruginibacter sp. SUN106 TaxID=2978348 RepID=UPI003D35A510
MLNKTHTKYIQTLHHKKFRDENGVFIAEGPKVVLELLDSREFVCLQLFAVEEWLISNAKTLQQYSGTEIFTVKDFELEKISLLTTANNVLAIFKKKEQRRPAQLKEKITLVLDTIQDPGNLGTIIRTADWFGVENIICSPACADMYNPKVVQSTMGSLARVNIFYTNLQEWLQENETIKKYAAALEGKNIKTLKDTREAIIIIGNEGKGISDAVMSTVDEKITIPKTGEAESLNAAVATGIILAAFS